MPPNTMTLLKDIEQLIIRPSPQGGGVPTANYNGMTLRSSFQPILNLAHRTIPGHEALIRIHDSQGFPISPHELFKQATTIEQIVFLDRLCRALHAASYEQTQVRDKWLFFNLDPRAIHVGHHYGPFFKEMLNKYSIPVEQVVIEVLEHEVEDNDYLAESFEYYRDIGCLIALDDFGAGHSNFNRVWTIKPDVVKIDRSMLVAARNASHIRRSLPRLVDLLHESGALVLLEGVENESEAIIALDSGVDLVQGFYFYRPDPLPVLQSKSEHILSIYEKFNAYSIRQRLGQHGYMQPFILYFQSWIKKVKQSDHAAVMQCSVQLPGAELCFILDEKGFELDEKGFALAYRKNFQSMNLHPHWNPLNQPTNGACWSYRSYYRKAMENQGTIQVSTPYLSLRTTHFCQTLSCAIYTASNQLVILCLDVKFNGDY